VDPVVIEMPAAQPPRASCFASVVIDDDTVLSPPRPQERIRVGAVDYGVTPVRRSARKVLLRFLAILACLVY
jgi:hypothetical protein